MLGCVANVQAAWDRSVQVACNRDAPMELGGSPQRLPVKHPR